MRTTDEEVKTFYRAAPGGVPTTVAFSARTSVTPSWMIDRVNGCIRDKAHAYSQDGGLAVLYGNIAEDGCIVKTAGVDESILKFTGRARMFESQDDAVAAILADKIVAGDVVVIRYEGPRGGPGMQEMLYPTSYLKSKGMGKVCALLTDGRFSGGTSGLVHRPRLAGSGGRRRDRPGRGRRHHRNRHSQSQHQLAVAEATCAIAVRDGRERRSRHGSRLTACARSRPHCAPTRR